MSERRKKDERPRRSQKTTLERHAIRLARLLKKQKLEQFTKKHVRD